MKKFELWREEINQPITERHIIVTVKIKASITGLGKTKYKAEEEATKTAREVSDTTYRVIRKNTIGKEDNWICTMLIEYVQK
jgi:hypothetical protein